MVFKGLMSLVGQRDSGSFGVNPHVTGSLERSINTLKKFFQATIAPELKLPLSPRTGTPADEDVQGTASQAKA